MNLLKEKNPAAVIKFVYEDEKKIVDFNGEAMTIAERYEDGNLVVYSGLGKEKDNLLTFADSAAEAVRRIKKLKKTSVEIILPQNSQDFAEFAVESVVLANYSFDKYLSKKPTKIENLHINLYAENLNWDKLEQVKIIAESVNYARDLINENAVVITPEFLANEAKIVAKSNKNMKIEILDEKEIQEKGLGLLWAVGKGSATFPRLIVVSYKGNENSEEFCALAGKGLTFDSGGLNLKPSGSIEDMRHDMSGAAAVLGVLKAASKINPKVNFLAVIPAAQSAIGKDAYFVGDVYKSYSGKFVEVLNTDAEGRLILADAFEYVLKNYKPKEIVDIATLTGAIVIALGNTIAGMFSNNDELAQKLFNSGEKTGERLWKMPIRPEHREAIKSDIADVLNTSTIKRCASSITAAAFLEFFAGHTPWCHLDIAGTAWNESSAKGINPKYATGFGVRLLWDFISN
ncbi:MAG: leucyl aminopeptidase [Chitinispirillales bacterium]|jgi:leucyl aminopeptidase|nr:leucyl aminopeptidase [Chitinispirillales bacterium]